MKSSTNFICQQCGFNSPSWLGRCPECQSWNSLVETVVSRKSNSGALSSDSQIVPMSLSQIEKEDLIRVPTGLAEFDRTLGGGIVSGSVVLIGGDPGIGKSTLMLQLALNLSTRGLSSLIIAGEESPPQIKIRVDRIGKASDHIKILPETNVDLVIESIREAKVKVVIVDSVQTLFTTEMEGSSGSVGQLRECTWRLVRMAKKEKVPVFLIGHVTKEGVIAGPKVLEHLVDTVLYLEGERYHTYRILRSIKNRFGKSDEIGIFEMSENGLKEVSNPSEEFLSETASLLGSAVVSSMEGSRPILAEIQALTTTTIYGLPTRRANGIDLNRLQMLSAVLSRRAGIQLGDQDIFVNVAGGLRISEPAVDLGVCLAIASNILNRPLPAKSVVVGEVGLQGEIRSVPGQEKRIKEAQKIGFSNIIAAPKVKILREAILLLKNTT